MSGLTKAFTLYAANLDKSGTGNDTFFDQVQDKGFSPGITEILAGGDGGIYNLFAGVGQQDPRGTFATQAVAKALSAVGINGVDFAKATGVTALDLYFQAYAQGGTRGGDGTNTKLTFNKGILLPRTLTADQTTPAQIALEAAAIWDGDNDPVSIAVDQNLPGTPAVDEIFYAGPASLGGVQLDSVSSLNWDFGRTLLGPLFSDGDVWGKYTGIQSGQSRITLTGLDLELINILGLTGQKQEVGECIIYLKRAEHGATRYADGASQHIKLEIDKGLAFVDDESASQGSEGTVSVTILPIPNGADDPVQITTLSAITF